MKDQCLGELIKCLVNSPVKDVKSFKIIQLGGDIMSVVVKDSDANKHTFKLWKCSDPFSVLARKCCKAALNISNPKPVNVAADSAKESEREKHPEDQPVMKISLKKE